MKKARAAYFPVFLNLEGRRCAVIGGGLVSLRKVKSLLRCGARVDVVSPSFCQGLTALAAEGRVTLIKRSYRPGDLAGALIAVAATGDGELNARIWKDGRKANVPVNVVDDAAVSDFILPALLRRGGITIAVSTSGMSPALARRIRTRLEGEIGPEYAALAMLVEEVRGELRRSGAKISAARWQAALDLDALLELIRDGKKQQAGSLLRRSLGIKGK